MEAKRWIGSPLRRLVAPATLAPMLTKRLPVLFALTIPALFAFSACGDGTVATASTGDDPLLASCTSPPLCDPIGLPGTCEFSDNAIICGASTGGGTDAGDSDAGPSAGGPDLTARLQCALEALRDRRTGGLALLLPENGSKTCGIRVEILSFGDGTASVLPVSYCDLDIVRGTAARRVLQPVSFFEKCLASNDETTRLTCLAKAIKTISASGAACPCRGIHADKFRGFCSSD